MSLLVRIKPDGSKKLVSDENFYAGDVVHSLNINNHKDRDIYTVELKIDGKIIHVIDPLFMYCNHSFAPTVHVDYNSGNVIAINDLYFGEEITFNYLTTESEISNPFKDSLTGIIVKK